MRRKMSFCFCAVPALLLCLILPALAGGQIRNAASVGGNLLPNGFYITPTAAPGSIFQNLPTGLRPDGSANANGAVNTALSPDGTALLILTTGYNTDFYTQGPDGTAILWAALDPLTGIPSIHHHSECGVGIRFRCPWRAAKAETTDQHPQHLSRLAVGSVGHALLRCRRH